MNKEQYMRELKKLLRHLPKEEFDQAIAYFEEYFEDAGPEQEEAAITNLGTPEEAADQIIRDMAIQNTKQPIHNMKKGAAAVWIGILAVFAMPVALPLTAVALAVIVLLLACVIIILAALLMCAVALVITGPVYILGGFSVLFQSFPTALVCLGLGFAHIGCGLLFAQGMCFFIRKFFHWIIKLLGNMVKKGGQKNA